MMRREDICINLSSRKRRHYFIKTFGYILFNVSFIRIRFTQLHAVSGIAIYFKVPQALILKADTKLIKKKLTFLLQRNVKKSKLNILSNSQFFFKLSFGHYGGDVSIRQALTLYARAQGQCQVIALLPHITTFGNTTQQHYYNYLSTLHYTYYVCRKHLLY